MSFVRPAYALIGGDITICFGYIIIKGEIFNILLINIYQIPTAIYYLLWIALFEWDNLLSHVCTVQAGWIPKSRNIQRSRVAPRHAGNYIDRVPRYTTTQHPFSASRLKPDPVLRIIRVHRARPQSFSRRPSIDGKCLCLPTLRPIRPIPRDRVKLRTRVHLPNGMFPSLQSEGYIIFLQFQPRLHEHVNRLKYKM